MKVLLTGANGFVGSHILDCLLESGHSIVALLRAGANTRLIDGQLGKVEVRRGALANPEELKQAVRGVAHVIHCAGSTRALGREEFFAANEVGTRNLAEACAREGCSRFVHISSLAAAGPSTADAPSREDGVPHPVSTYGESKLAGEKVVQAVLPQQHIILRPPAVYGPRDGEFLRLYKAVRSHIAPRPPRQQLSLVYVRDLARVAVAALSAAPNVTGTFNVACEEVVTARDMATEVSSQMASWTIPLPLPNSVFWAVCLGQEVLSQITQRSNVLNMQKYSELKAPGWVCSTRKLREGLQVSCDTNLKIGTAETLKWYREEGWL